MSERAKFFDTREGLKNNPPSQQTRLPERAPGRPLELQTRLPSGEDANAADASARVSLEEILGRVRSLPSLPVVALQVIQMTNQEDTTLRDIAQCISKDPSFSARILKLANSAHYGLPRAVSTISEAVTMLGNHTVRNLAIMAATQDTLCNEVSGYELGRGDLWIHSLGCAMAAEMLATLTHYPAPEEAFVAGLLHDVGKIIISAYIQDSGEKLATYMEKENCTFLEAEKAVLGFDHAEVGGKIALRWNLPIKLAQAILWHHEPVQKGKVEPLAALIHVANMLCLTAGIGLGKDGLRTTIDTQVLQSLSLDEAQIEDILSKLVTRLAEAKPLFTMQTT